MNRPPPLTRHDVEGLSRRLQRVAMGLAAASFAAFAVAYVLNAALPVILATLAAAVLPGALFLVGAAVRESPEMARIAESPATIPTAVIAQAIFTLSGIAVARTGDMMLLLFAGVVALVAVPGLWLLGHFTLPRAPA